MSSPGVYVERAWPVIAQLLSHQDRDPHSPSYGCFDRPYWGWKFKEFANATDQYALVCLAHVWGHDTWGVPNPYFRNANLRRWIEGGLTFWLRAQHADGSFDQAFPNEHGVGVTFYLASGICRVMELIGDFLDDELRARVLAGLRRAGEFLVTHEETHGLIANHLAKNEMALYQLATLCQEPRFLAGARALRARLRQALSSEGWFFEYVGPDPGYQTQTLYYLMAYYRKAKDEELLDMAVRGVRDFGQYFVHPDGSIGGEYGVRGTEIIYPAGLEMLRSVLPEASAAARAVRRAVAQETTVGLGALDFTSLIRLAANYFEAAAITEPALEPSALPCETTFARWFPKGGLLAVATPGYYAAVNAAKGGVLKVFDKRSGWLVGEDWGYTARLADGSTVTSQMVDPKPVVRWDGQVLETTVRFGRYLNTNLTVLQMLVLRILNMTVLRFPKVNDLFKRVVARRLMTGKRLSTLTLTRRLRFDADGIGVEDRIATGGARGSVVRLERGRRSFPIHMASARFFQAQQLVAPEAGEDLVGRLDASGEAGLTWRVTVDPGR